MNDIVEMVKSLKADLLRAEENLETAKSVLEIACAGEIDAATNEVDRCESYVRQYRDTLREIIDAAS